MMIGFHTKWYLEAISNHQKNAGGLKILLLEQRKEILEKSIIVTNKNIIQLVAKKLLMILNFF
ncbi:hypothetical protein [Okeania sp. SIO1I7]|uniref:hypothetical protein n=1 Tax=Okeania sp. SIO1I7 TaxID=2607772 RepID=UPI0025F36516|nr:hypothetical protein [Okeania sp. SIO1I7]